jgi:GNAT superfamily N-acetyltransferase
VTPSPLERAFAFERSMLGAAGRVVTGAWGQAFLSPELDRCYDRNVLWIGDGAEDASASAESIDAQAERLLGGSGMEHRRILVEPAADVRLRDGLVACGYARSANVFMVFGDDGDGPAVVDGVEVVDASVGAVDAGCERYLLTDPDTEYGRDVRTRFQLLDHHREYGPQAAAERRFAVLGRDRTAVAWARLWRRGGEAQVEDVVCLAEHRGHGYGRAVVAAAARAALADGTDLLFIVADAADWPRDLYERLGFRAAGELAVYQRFAPR